jgi:hypothetical protein
MKPTEKIEERAKGAMETVSKIAEKLPNPGDLLNYLADREIELRLKFDSLTLDGDIAIALTALKSRDSE